MRVGAIDTEAKAYLSSPDKVADAFNYWVYGGRDVIKPEGLTPLDTTAIVLPYGNDAKKPIQKIRDVLKLYTAMRDSQAYYLILVSRLVHIHNNCPLCSHLRRHRQLT